MNAMGKGRRPWLRYSLRGLFLVTTILCVWLALLFNQARRQRRAVVAIADTGGVVAFDYHFRQKSKDAQPPGPAWLRRLIGDELFRTPQHVELRGEKITDEFLAEHLPGLRGVQVLIVASPHLSDAALANAAKHESIHILSLACPRVTDTGLEHLARMQQLTALELECPQVTDSGMQHLAKLTKLKRIRLFCPQITAGGVRRLTPLTDLRGVTSVRDPGNQPSLDRLRSRSNVDLADVPLADALEFVAQTYQVNIHQTDIREDQRMRAVRVVAKGQTLKWTLDTILSPTGLDYYLQHEVIMVAPRPQAAQHRAGERAFRDTLPSLDWLEVDW